MLDENYWLGINLQIPCLDPGGDGGGGGVCGCVCVEGGGASICWGYGDVPPLRVYFLSTCGLSGYTFLPIFLICVFSGMLFNLIVSCVPSGYTISRFLYRILCSLRVRVR